MRTNTYSRGVSLIEVLIAIALFILAIATLGTLGFSGAVLAREGSERMEAFALGKEGIEAARAIRTDNYADLTPGTHGLSMSGGVWEFTGNSETFGPFTRSITVTPIGSGRTEVASDVSWTLSNGRPGSVRLVSYIHNLFSSFWLQSTTAEFSGGKQNGVRVTQDGNGAVALTGTGNWTIPRLHASLDLFGNSNVRSLKESDGTLYVGSAANGGQEFVSVDISNTENGEFPVIGVTAMNASVNDVLISGKYAYLATSHDSQEIAVVRRSDHVVVNSVNLPGTADALSLTASGTMLYVGRVASGNHELYALNIASPEAAIGVVQNVHHAGNIRTLVTLGQYIIAGSSANSTELLVFNSANLATANSLDLPGNSDATRLAIRGSRLYVARTVSSDFELAGIDITSPTDPLTVSAGLHTVASINDMHIGSDERIYLATQSSSGELVVVSPIALAITRVFDIGSGTAGLAVFASSRFTYVGMSGTNPELNIMRGGEGSWTAPLLLGNTNTVGTSDGFAIAADGNYSYLGTAVNNGAGEFYIIDRSIPSAPLVVGGVEINASVNDVVVNANFAYLATTDNSRELIIVNITNKSSPTIIGSYSSSGNSDGLSVMASGTTIYLGTANNTSGSGRELYAVNVSVPASPILAGSLEVGGNVNGVIQGGSYLALATSNDAKELVIVGGTNPSAPVEISSYNTQGAADGLSLTHNSGNVYLGTQNNGISSDLYIFDLPQNGNATLRSFLDVNADNRSLAVSGGLLFIGNSATTRGLAIYDVLNPSAPIPVSTWNPGAIVRDVAPANGLVFLATTNNNQEFAIIGPAEVSAELAREGWLRSSAFDAGTSIVSWGNISWTSSATGTISLQTRTASSLAGLSTAIWMGGGTVGGYYVAPGEAVTIDPGASGTQWIEYRARLTGDGTTTPLLEDVTVSYN